jgi:hypothetical protein
LLPVFTCFKKFSVKNKRFQKSALTYCIADFRIFWV